MAKCEKETKKGRLNEYAGRKKEKECVEWRKEKECVEWRKGKKVKKAASFRLLVAFMVFMGIDHGNSAFGLECGVAPLNPHPISIRTTTAATTATTKPTTTPTTATTATTKPTTTTTAATTATTKPTTTPTTATTAGTATISTTTSTKTSTVDCDFCNTQGRESTSSTAPTTTSAATTSAATTTPMATTMAVTKPTSETTKPTSETTKPTSETTTLSTGTNTTQNEGTTAAPTKATSKNPNAVDINVNVNMNVNININFPGLERFFRGGRSIRENPLNRRHEDRGSDDIGVKDDVKDDSDVNDDIKVDGDVKDDGVGIGGNGVSREKRNMPALHKSSSAPFVLGGSTAKYGAWPWMVSLKQRGYHQCGGTIISERFIVTAAHCFDKKGGRDPLNWRVTVAEHHIRNADFWEENLLIDLIIVHEEWNRPNHLQNDLAMVRLKTPLNFDPNRHVNFAENQGNDHVDREKDHVKAAMKNANQALDHVTEETNTYANHVTEETNTYANHVRPACLPRPDWDVRSRSDCWLAGWGYFKIEEYQGQWIYYPASVLQEVKGYVWPEDGCKDKWKSTLQPGMLCFGHDQDHVKVYGSCLGDSGGPLVCLDERNRYVLSGVVSFGRSDCLMLPNVFTDVTKYVDWIYMNMLSNE